MSIQISGTTVIDQNRYIQNVQAYYGPGIASQAEAQAGTNNDQLMTPLRVKQAWTYGGTITGSLTVNGTITAGGYSLASLSQL